MEPENPALDEFLLSLVDKPVPRLLFLPTASGDAEKQVTTFRATYSDRPCEASALSLFRLSETPGISLRDLVLRQDVVYVGGGSMRSMLAIWREYELDGILREAWERGIVLAGLSAGAMCWFAGGVTTSTGIPRPVEGLGLLPFSLSVHADNDLHRLPVFEAGVASDVLPAGWAADDGVGLLFCDDRLERVVTSRPETRAVHVKRTAGGGLVLVRTPIIPTLLSAASLPERAVDGDVLEFRRTRHAAVRRGAR